MAEGLRLEKKIVRQRPDPGSEPPFRLQHRPHLSPEQSPIEESRSQDHKGIVIRGGVLSVPEGITIEIPGNQSTFRVGMCHPSSDIITAAEKSTPSLLAIPLGPSPEVFVRCIGPAEGGEAEDCRYE
jgi:hypothetical protein